MGYLREQYKRVVIYQPRSAWVADLGPCHILAPRFTEDEDRFRTAAGTQKAISRSRSLVIPVYDANALEHLRNMWLEGCEIQAILVGANKHLVWALDSEINLVNFGGGPGELSGANLVLNTDIFLGSIWQSEDVLSGLPWVCQTATDDGTGTYYFPGPSGWQGLQWSATNGTTTDEDGLLSGSVTLDMKFPLEGATCTISNFVGSLKTLDWSGATLSTNSVTLMSPTNQFTVDDGTWTIQVTATTATGPPTLTIDDPGTTLSRAGGCIDCTDLTAELGSAPDWSS